MKKCPFHELLEKTQLTDVEKIALYGVMRTSTAPDWTHLSPREVWDRMIQEYDNLKMMAHFEGVPQDISDSDRVELKTEIDEFRSERDRKLDDLLMIPPASRFKQ